MQIKSLKCETYYYIYDDVFTLVSDSDGDSYILQETTPSTTKTLPLDPRLFPDNPQLVQAICDFTQETTRRAKIWKARYAT